jgi:hypothetical protein
MVWAVVNIIVIFSLHKWGVGAVGFFVQVVY